MTATTMTAWRKGLAIVLVGLLAPTVGVLASEGAAHVLIPDDAAPQVGDRLAIDIVLDWPSADVTPRFPAWTESWGDAEVLEVGPVERQVLSDGVVSFLQPLVIAAYRPGEIELPPQPIEVTEADGETVTVQTPVTTYTIVSVLPSDAEPTALAPKAAAEPVALDDDWGFGITAAILLAVVLAAGIFAALRRYPVLVDALGRVIGPRLAPLDELLGRLRGLDPQADAERQATRLSLALRTYLGRRLGFPAVESTTSEIRRRLADGLPAPLVHQAVRVLAACDEVKFAQRYVTPADTQARIDDVRAVALEIERHTRIDDESEPAVEAAA
ncbi:MAG: hypothetical protein AAGD38_17890 [Acidobacteriota bacterium]